MQTAKKEKWTRNDFYIACCDLSAKRVSGYCRKKDKREYGIYKDTDVEIWYLVDLKTGIALEHARTCKELKDNFDTYESVVGYNKLSYNAMHHHIVAFESAIYETERSSKNG